MVDGAGDDYGTESHSSNNDNSAMSSSDLKQLFELQLKSTSDTHDKIRCVRCFKKDGPEGSEGSDDDDDGDGGDGGDDADGGGGAGTEGGEGGEGGDGDEDNEDGGCSISTAEVHRPSNSTAGHVVLQAEKALEDDLNSWAHHTPITDIAATDVLPDLGDKMLEATAASLHLESNMEGDDPDAHGRGVSFVFAFATEGKLVPIEESGGGQAGKASERQSSGRAGGGGGGGKRRRFRGGVRAPRGQGR